MMCNVCKQNTKQNKNLLKTHVLVEAQTILRKRHEKPGAAVSLGRITTQLGPSKWKTYFSLYILLYLGIFYCVAVMK